MCICVEVSAALFGDGVAGGEAAECGGVVAEVVVDEVEFGVVVLRRPLEGLGNVAGFRYVPEGSVAVRRADVARPCRLLGVSAFCVSSYRFQMHVGNSKSRQSKITSDHEAIRI